MGAWYSCSRTSIAELENAVSCRQSPSGDEEEEFVDGGSS
jgi:hypothetical protein